MPFTPDQIKTLTDVVSTYVPLAILLDLPKHRVPLELEEWRKEKPEVLARKVVEAFNQRNKVPLLARALLRRFYRDDVVAAKLAEFCNEGDDTYLTRQAALAQRSLTMSSAKLRRFLAEAEPRICVVLADAKEDGLRTGTGFLVGPDLIITAYHTLEFHVPRNGGLGPEMCLAVFDHLEGGQIHAFPPADPQVRCVAFADADDWCVKYSEPNNCDFVLVRLKEPIGLESYTGNGGSRRGWFTFDAFREILFDERIIIPQHPFGYRQQQDFGRYVEEANGGLSIRYTTETALGSSGAPCFASFGDEQRLVAMHNGVYEPYRVPVLNQAVRFDHIAECIRDELQAVRDRGLPPQAVLELWSVTAAPRPPRPILGRKLLITWIGAAESDTAQPRERVFVTEGVVPRSGRSFTEEILRAARLESRDPVAVIGNERDVDERVPLPLDAADLLQAILKELPFKASIEKPFPPRPALGGSGEGKLAKWSAGDLVTAFDKLLGSNRVYSVDERKQAEDAAREAQFDLQRAMERAGRDGASEDDWSLVKARRRDVDRLKARLTELAARSPDELIQLRSRWDRIWIAVMVAGPSKLSTEVTELLSGLIQSKHDEMMRIRWLLVGDIPDALKALSAYKVERLDPAAIGLDDYVACVEKIAASLGRPLSPPGVEAVRLMGGAVVDYSNVQPDKLRFLQEMLARMGPAAVKQDRNG